jgi:thiamine-phosphate pyrophosphorylase
VSITLPRIYPITDVRLAGLSHAAQVKELINGGATLIQLREKYLPAATFYEDAASALRIARAAGVKIIINDRADLALALGADGVHLGQEDLPVEAARRLLGPQAIIGFSTHTIEQAKAALTLPLDYLAYGPIYGTSTKTNPDPTVGPEQLRQVRNLTSLPLIAIGGIDSRTVPEVLATGADSAAVISAVLAPPDTIGQNLKNMINLTRTSLQDQHL